VAGVERDVSKVLPPVLLAVLQPGHTQTYRFKNRLMQNAPISAAQYTSTVCHAVGM
jgi:hypothetical protein